MKVWQEEQAGARFSELLDACVSEGPQLVSRRGTALAVLVPIEEWKRLNTQASASHKGPPSLKALLLSEQGRGDLVLSERGQI